jgi:hypothetical protein
MKTLEQDMDNFWSDTYCGRPIAILNRSSGWHVYLDHVLQHNMRFESAEKAVVWLINRIDQGNLPETDRNTSRGRARRSMKCPPPLADRLLVRATRFSDTSAFSTAFRKATGMTPSGFQGSA